MAVALPPGPGGDRNPVGTGAALSADPAPVPGSAPPAAAGAYCRGAPPSLAPPAVPGGFRGGAPHAAPEPPGEVARAPFPHLVPVRAPAPGSDFSSPGAGGGLLPSFGGIAPTPAGTPNPNPRIHPKPNPAGNGALAEAAVARGEAGERLKGCGRVRGKHGCTHTRKRSRVHTTLTLWLCARDLVKTAPAHTLTLG